MTEWPFIRVWKHCEVVGSTNDFARDCLISGELELPLLVTADQQTAGRGRGANRWWSDSGSLTATVALDPSSLRLLPVHQPRAALATAVAVIDVLEDFYPSVPFRIRWPNDLEVRGRKLGGLLAERCDTISGPGLLIGIGLNVSTRFNLAPPEIQRMAVALNNFSVANEAPNIDKLDLLRAILTRLPVALEKLAADDPSLATRWNDLDALAGLEVRIAQGSRVVNGVARGIDASGGLRLQTPDSTVVVYGGQVLR
jgi:BirA family transcriptional regulator, biotin operon repressor / biotin---[acetyl-CoA-carboxylase] ligase